MPWTPTFWIQAQDDKRILPELAKLHSEEILRAFEFKLPNADGFIVIPDTERTQPHSNLHDLFKSENVEHWIVDGEGGANCCHEWGKERDIEMDAALEQAERKGR